MDGSVMLLSIRDVAPIVPIVNACKRRSVQSTQSTQSKRISWHNSIFGLLPDEIALLILHFCNTKTVRTLAQVCRQWRRITGDEVMWKAMALERWPHVERVPIGWRHDYMRKERIENRWWNGRMRMRPLQGHAGPVSCVRFNNDVLLSASLDSTIKVWYMQSELCVHTIRGHSRAVWNLQYDDRRVVSCGDDRLVNVFDLYSGQLVSSLAGHGNWVHALQFDGDRVVSGSGDKLAHVWDLRTSAISHVLRGHTGPVESLHYVGDTLVTGSCDKTVRVWDMRTMSTLQTFAVGGWVTGVQQSGNDVVVSMGGPNEAQDWDLTTGLLKQTWQGHGDFVMCVAADRVRVVTGSRDCTIRVNDWSGQCRSVVPLQYRTEREHILPVARNSIKCLAFDESRLVVGTNDCLIRVMSYA
eukprot:TRINITY_DN5033_c0_g1_i1.p1 TRINITY_DN5033_c0_g1~~TRINITY_DN5033_c0_g1_i1.p1  ORF type:complete len:412 (+),score=62.18 TRINITY_DN5033_c0_g1_i1:77-1312(+)